MPLSLSTLGLMWQEKFQHLALRYLAAKIMIEKLKLGLSKFLILFIWNKMWAWEINQWHSSTRRDDSAAIYVAYQISSWPYSATIQNIRGHTSWLTSQGKHLCKTAPRCELKFLKNSLMRRSTSDFAKLGSREKNADMNLRWYYRYLNMRSVYMHYIRIIYIHKCAHMPARGATRDIDDRRRRTPVKWVHRLESQRCWFGSSIAIRRSSRDRTHR